MWMWRWQSLALSSGLGKLVLPEKWPWGLWAASWLVACPHSPTLHCLPSSPVHFLGASRRGSGPPIEAALWALGATPGPCQGGRDSLDTSSQKGREPATTAAPRGWFKVLPSHPEISVMTSHEVWLNFCLATFSVSSRQLGSPNQLLI